MVCFVNYRLLELFVCRMNITLEVNAKCNEKHVFAAMSMASMHDSLWTAFMRHTLSCMRQPNIPFAFDLYM